MTVEHIAMYEDDLEGTQVLFGKLGRTSEIIVLDLLFLGAFYFFNIQLTGTQGREQTIYFTLG